MSKKTKNRLTNPKISKKVIVRETVTKRTFTYSKDSTNLSFTLNIENPREMEDFMDLLKLGIQDISEQIELTNKK